MNKNGTGIYQNEPEWGGMYWNKPEYAGTKRNDSGIKPNGTGMGQFKQELCRNIPERGGMTIE